jgi:hypothetical protein
MSNFDTAHTAIADITQIMKQDVIPNLTPESLEYSIAFKVLFELGFTLGLATAAHNLG